jgi:hypothetical protein
MSFGWPSTRSAGSRFVPFRRPLARAVPPPHLCRARRPHTVLECSSARVLSIPVCACLLGPGWLRPCWLSPRLFRCVCMCVCTVCVYMCTCVHCVSAPPLVSVLLVLVPLSSSGRCSSLGWTRAFAAGWILQFTSGTSVTCRACPGCCCWSGSRIPRSASGSRSSRL